MTVWCPKCGRAAIRCLTDTERNRRRSAWWRCVECSRPCLTGDPPSRVPLRPWSETEETARLRYLLPRLYRRSASSACFRPGPAQDKWMALAGILDALRDAPWMAELMKRDREEEARRG